LLVAGGDLERLAVRRWRGIWRRGLRLNESRRARQTVAASAVLDDGGRDTHGRVAGSAGSLVWVLFASVLFAADIVARVERPLL